MIHLKLKVHILYHINNMDIKTIYVDQGSYHQLYKQANTESEKGPLNIYETIAKTTKSKMFEQGYRHNIYKQNIFMYITYMYIIIYRRYKLYI